MPRRRHGNDYTDAHHLIFPRQEWSMRKESLYLRSTPSLIPHLHRTIHNEIHRECSPLPLLGFYALQRTLKHFEPTDETLSSMDNLAFAIEMSSRNPKAFPIERELGELAIEALLAQRPYIESISNKRTVLDLASL